ncbi:MAG TPA: RsmE family RNA methyltransferase, partial [Armatimonadota bacterium]|nr:RsmE family RNA methyltransferase [Armatimonadota bacterium]
VGPHRVTAEVASRLRPEVELPCRIHLAVAVLKGEKLEWVVQKATELGAARVSFLRTERTVVEAGAERWARRRERYERIAREAAEQSGRVRVPEIGEPQPPAEALRAPAERSLILAPGAREPLARVLEPAPGSVLLLVGPEGGFTDAELALAAEAGAAPVGLGRRVLRAETAALLAVGLAAAQVEP